jgi:hypothetical protein
MNVIFWREAAAAEPVSVSSQQRQPALLVIEGGRDQLLADIERVADELRVLERGLAAARAELHRLLASLGPISMTMTWRR